MLFDTYPVGDADHHYSSSVAILAMQTFLALALSGAGLFTKLLCLRGVFEGRGATLHHLVANQVPVHVREAIRGHSQSRIPAPI